MGIYENPEEDDVQIGRGLAEKIRGMFRTFQLKRKIRAEEKKQEEIFRQMGEYYYHTYGEQAEGQMRIWCDAVWNNKTMIIQCKSQVRRIQGAFYCPNCNREVPPGSQYCNHCGARVVLAQPISIAASSPFSAKICSGCGKPLEKGQQFCPNCGERVSWMKSGVKRYMQEKAAETAEEERREAEEFEIVDQAVEREVRRQKEESPLQPENPSPAETEPKPENPSLAEAESKPGIRHCPSCGRELGDEYLFCPGCGLKVR